ncbi:MAG: hypothetical protein QOG20_3757 [Pseudonocardiales bacterium]|nr:hypothetical protein [Pseudonocardiales bacterium]
MTAAPERTAVTSPRTFRGRAGVGSPRLAGLAGVERVDVAPAEVLETERHDTDDRRLTAAGIALTLRRGGADVPATESAQWHLDLPDGNTAEQLRVPVPPDAGVAPVVPDELDELIRGASRERAVRPAGRVRTVRTISRLTADDGRPLATVVHDEITLATLGRSTEVEAWTEVSLHVDAADATLVAALEDRIAGIGLVPAAPAGEAELDRLLRPGRAAIRRPAGRKGSAGHVLHEHLSVQVERLAAQDLSVRRGEPDAVHQLRITARRLRSALQAYRPLLDRERTDPLVDALRALARQLAPARDAEVQRERITEGLASLDPRLVLGPVQAQVTRYFARAESEAHAAVLSALDGQAYIALRRGLDELVERPPLTKRASGKAAKVLPPLVARRTRRLDRAVAAATDPAVQGADRDVAIHTARKAAKRLRYATAVARPVAGKPAKRFARSLKAVQSALGEHQDTVVARETLRELGAQAHSAGENGFSFGVLFGRDAARAAAIEAELVQIWSAARAPKLRRWMR